MLRFSSFRVSGHPSNVTLIYGILILRSFGIGTLRQENGSNFTASKPHSLQVMGPTTVPTMNQNDNDNYSVGGGIGVKQLKVALLLEKWGKTKRDGTEELRVPFWRPSSEKATPDVSTIIEKIRSLTQKYFDAEANCPQH